MSDNPQQPSQQNMPVVRTDVPRELTVYACQRCGARREVASTAPAPECGEYNPGHRQRFPDGSWIHLGESYAPHGPMMDTGERIESNPLAGYRDDARRANRLEAERPAREAEYERAITPVDAPAGVTKAPTRSNPE